MKRLSKVLAAAGISSRRGCERLIFEGKVRVNGQVITTPQFLVHAEEDAILVRGSPLPEEEKEVYFIVNKPRGYICSSARDVVSKKVVIDLFEGVKQRLFTVGRLDQHTTGLLLLTNDGHFAQKVIHPSSNIVKEYLVKSRQEITHKHLQVLSKGVSIKGKWVKPADVRKIRRGTLKIRVREGKKHEVRLMMKGADLDLISLSRISIGALKLGPLKEGEWRALTHREKELIFS